MVLPDAGGRCSGRGATTSAARDRPGCGTTTDAGEVEHAKSRGTRRASSVAWVGVLVLAVLGFLGSANLPLRAQTVVLTEILAADGSLVDEDGDTPDWIEIQNQEAAPVELSGWYLTDDAMNLRKWRFPAGPLGPGAYLVVFASGKDRAEPGGEFHTNFKLSAEGEFLALVNPDGVSIADAWSPSYPPQHDGISYGIAQVVVTTPLVGEESPVRYLVPGGPVPADWTSPAHADGSWFLGKVGLGFDTDPGAEDPGEPVDLAPLGTASQSSEYPGGTFPASHAIDGEPETFTHTGAGQNLPATWELELPSAHPIQTVILHNRAECCPSRLRDITVSILDEAGGMEVFVSELLNPENEIGGGGTAGPDSLVVDVAGAMGGPVTGRIVRVMRTPDPDLSGTGGEGNSDEEDVLSLSEVEVLEGSQGFLPWIETDVETALHGQNASLFLRAAFTIEDPSVIEVLRLGVRYDDGFVAYLNGREIARGNAPTLPVWNSAASAERPDADALVARTFDVTAHLDALLPGANVLAVQALNLTAGDDDFLILPELVGSSYESESRLYFRQPTPGAPNDETGAVGFVDDTRFSPDRGFFDAPMLVTIETATAGARIYFTTDGSPPSETNGTLYSAPIRIEDTTTLRALAVKSGLEPTNIDTQTYIFIDGVIRQDRAATLAAGFPTLWGSTSPDYGMDPDIVGPNDRYGGLYAGTIREDLLAIPSLSIVMDIDDLLGSRGIYTNSTAGGIAWERAASVELLSPGEDGEFQIDCAIRAQGGYFRSHDATRKHSLRLLFKGEYGPEKLRFPLFGPRASDELDTIVLRAGANDGYSWDAARLTEQYTRDEYGRELQRAAGDPSARGVFVHLYLNGIYWGLYNATERPDHAFGASYFGGEKEDWDAVHNGVATNGDTVQFNAMITQATAARTNLEAFEKLQGRNPDGSRNPAYPHLLDLPNYCDYIAVNVWGGNWDWPWKNWWAGRSRTTDSTGFKFYNWDFENTMGNNRDRSPLSANALLNDYSGAGRPHQLLAQNPEYRLLFADRVQRLFFSGGPLTPEALIPRYETVAEGIERAMVGETARWGDQHFNPPLTLAEWITERNWITQSYLPQRTQVVLGHLKAAGLYPAIEAPRLSRRGGLALKAFHLALESTRGTVYYTTDGSDPRLPGGGVSPTASIAPLPESTTIISEGAAARYFVPADASLASDWTGADFDDSAWASGPTGIGYEGGSGYEGLIQTSVLGMMQGQNSTIYVRVPFDLDPSLFDGDQAAIAFLTLRMKYDDGYIAWVNGTKLGSKNAPASPAWNSKSTTSRGDNLAMTYESLDLSAAIPHLRPGKNVLAIQGLNASASNDDFLLIPEIDGTSAGGGIQIDRTLTVKTRALDGSEWSALEEATYVLDVGLRLTEVQYHPAIPEGEEREESDFEFVEFQNVSTRSIDLAALTIEGGIEFDFALGTVATLPPGGIVLVVKDTAAFAERYAKAGLRVAGAWRQKLDNLGDYFILRDGAGGVLLDFEYDDDWQPETDGSGPSLVIVDPRGAPTLWSNASSWKTSAFPQGSPGVDESSSIPGGFQVAGDLNQDANLDLSDAVALLGHLFLGSWQDLPCGDAALGDEANRILLDSNGDSRVDLSDAVHVLRYLFTGGPPPFLGEGCVPIDGCPDVCG